MRKSVMMARVSETEDKDEWEDEEIGPVFDDEQLFEQLSESFWDTTLAMIDKSSILAFDAVDHLTIVD